MQRALFTFALGVCLSVGAYAQENRLELGASATGNFMKSTTGNGLKLSTDDRAGVGANFRFWFTKRQGLEVSWSNANLYQRVDLPNTSGFRTYMNEATAAYVLRLPTWSSRFQPFVLAGGGALVFSPNGNSLATTYAKPTFTYGGGIDAYLTKRIGLRAQYKGFVLDNPNGGIAAFDTNRVAHMAQPSAGVFWRF